MELVESWVLSLRAKLRSENTVKAYRADLNHFTAHYGGDPADATRRDIEAFLVACHDKGLADATVARRYRSLQQFYRWLEEEEEVERSPMAKMSPPSVVDNPPKFPSDDDVRAILAACQDKQKAANGRHGKFERDRDSAIVLLLATSGVRVGELVGMRVDDVHLAHGTFDVTGKGRKERTLPLLPQASEAVDRYLRTRRKHPYAGLAWLWVGERGRFTDWGVRQMLERRCDDAGIERVNPHAFRHRFTHVAKTRRMSDEDIMEHNGWSTPQMLHRYGRSARAERARDAVRETFKDDRF